MAKTTKTTKTDQPSFEKALADLEHIVDKLEKGGLALNESLALFEKGVKLARFLRDELDCAEKKVEILLKDEKGNLKRAPFKLGEEGLEVEDPSAEDEEEDKEDEDEEEDDSDPSDKKGGKLPF
jgi:exodeoxyribonuclease VII small subunit